MDKKFEHSSHWQKHRVKFTGLTDLRVPQHQPKDIRTFSFLQYGPHQVSRFICLSTELVTPSHEVERPEGDTAWRRARPGWSQ